MAIDENAKPATVIESMVVGYLTGLLLADIDRPSSLLNNIMATTDAEGVIQNQMRLGVGAHWIRITIEDEADGD